MCILRLLLIAAVGLLGASGTAPAQYGQPETHRKSKLPIVPAGTARLTFFLAKGEPGACGPGCSEWIAAEGTFDRDAATRFDAFLSRLGPRSLPIFFHSAWRFSSRRIRNWPNAA